MTVREFGDNLYYIGPFSHKSAMMEVEPLEPKCEAIKQTIESLESKGVRITHGRWLIDGAPMVILFDLGSLSNRLDEWKGDFYNCTKIPFPASDTETNDAILLGYAIAWFLGEVYCSKLTC